MGKRIWDQYKNLTEHEWSKDWYLKNICLTNSQIWKQGFQVKKRIDVSFFSDFLVVKIMQQHFNSSKLIMQDMQSK